MTVDMLAAAFIWPEEMLLGRTRIGDDPAPGRSDGIPPRDEARDDPGTAPFWVALARRLRADPPAASLASR